MTTPHISISAHTEDRMLFDAGAVYRDYGEVTQELIGATRGGATWTVERDDREVDVDGARGPIKGLVRTVRETARLEVELLEITLQTLVDLLKGTVVSDGVHKKVRPTLDIIAADYYTNIALVAKSSGAAASIPIILKLLNAMQRGEWSISTTDKEEGVLACTFVAHYNAATPETVPYDISIPVGAS